MPAYYSHLERLKLPGPYPGPVESELIGWDPCASILKASQENQLCSQGENLWLRDLS